MSTQTTILAKREQQKWANTAYAAALGTDVVVTPGPAHLHGLVSLARSGEHVNVVLPAVWELRGVLVAQHHHGVDMLHVGRLPIVFEAPDFDRRGRGAKRVCGGCRAARWTRRCEAESKGITLSSSLVVSTISVMMRYKSHGSYAIIISREKGPP